MLKNFHYIVVAVNRRARAITVIEVEFERARPNDASWLGAISNCERTRFLRVVSASS
jgi:hypothetical protein